VGGRLVDDVSRTKRNKGKRLMDEKEGRLEQKAESREQRIYILEGRGVKKPFCRATFPRSLAWWLGCGVDTWLYIL
jgi:hypothetical protein